jgi:hypothetical protein
MQAPVASDLIGVSPEHVDPGSDGSARSVCTAMKERNNRKERKRTKENNERKKRWCKR